MQKMIGKALWMVCKTGAIVSGVILLGTAGASDLGRIDVAVTACRALWCVAGIVGFGAVARVIRRAAAMRMDVTLPQRTRKKCEK